MTPANRHSVPCTCVYPPDYDADVCKVHGIRSDKKPAPDNKAESHPTSSEDPAVDPGRLEIACHSKDMTYARLYAIMHGIPLDNIKRSKWVEPGRIFIFDLSEIDMIFTTEPLT